jgi:hypothetical protein
MNDPAGINYPDDPELRKVIAQQLDKVLRHDPGLRQRAEDWPDYAAEVVRELEASTPPEQNGDAG